MQFFVYMREPAECAALFHLLNIWKMLIFSPVKVECWVPGNEEKTGIFFWDLDAGMPPISGKTHHLILCSSSDRAAISSYALHPAGFLRKPIQMAELWNTLLRLTYIWWDSLERVELISDRLRLRLPLCELVWTESTRRGCLIHSSKAPIFSRETLTALESRLPENFFLRCQRGFLVNLCHVRRLDSLGLHMSDGAVVPLNRGSRGRVNQAYQWFCGLWDGAAPFGGAEYA